MPIAGSAPADGNAGSVVMRISKPCLMVVCLLAPLCVGCQSGGSFAMKDMWPWGKKAGAESSVAGGTNYPQTPAQMAQAPDASMPSQSYGAPGAVPQSNPYAGQPPSSMLPGSYAGAPTGEGAGLYDNSQPYTGYPTSSQPAPQVAQGGGYPLTDPNTGMAQNQYAGAAPSFTPPA